MTTVKNMTRDYAYYVARRRASLYREDTDRVVAVLREVADEMLRPTPPAVRACWRRSR